LVLSLSLARVENDVLRRKPTNREAGATKMALTTKRTNAGATRPVRVIAG
jgi:hypothetical protein